jgi:hypothetical protein
MNDKKIIIRNCPCYNNERFIDGFLDDKATFCTYYGKKCQGCTDCVLKQIVELCKGLKCPCEYKGADCWECTESGAKRLADRILKLLVIQEVE